jgi:hypothetical protein
MDVYLFRRRTVKVMYHKSATCGTMIAKCTESILGACQAVKWDPPTGREVGRRVVCRHRAMIGQAKVGCRLG